MSTNNDMTYTYYLLNKFFLLQDVTVVVGEPVDYTELVQTLKDESLSTVSTRFCERTMYYLCNW